MAAPMNHMRGLFTSSANTCFRKYLGQKCFINAVSCEFYSPVTCCHNVKFYTTAYFARNVSKQRCQLSENKTCVQCSRTFASDSNPNVRGAVVYVQNPLSWLKTKWILFNLHNKYDPAFTIDEFLVGAKQALCVVTELLSQKKFEELKGLVHQEVISWLEQHLNDMTAEETEALNLKDDNIALLKARGMDLVETKDEVKLYVDTLCFGLKRDSNPSSGIPFMVDLGFRFCRDYSSTPPGDWYIGGVTHIRVQRLV